MKKYINEVRDYYREEYSYNDPAHRIDHADKVCKNVLEISDKLNLRLNKRMLVIAAYIHDLKCHVDRSKHHILAHEYAMSSMSDRYLKTFNIRDRAIIAEAVLEHRSSFKGIRKNILSRILAVADIGPVCLEEVIERSFKYHSSKNDSIETTIKDIYDHLQDKFSSKGYRKYDEMYIAVYGDIVDRFKKEVDKITLNDIRKVVGSVS